MIAVWKQINIEEVYYRFKLHSQKKAFINISWFHLAAYFREYVRVQSTPLSF